MTIEQYLEFQKNVITPALEELTEELTEEGFYPFIFYRQFIQDLREGTPTGRFAVKNAPRAQLTLVIENNNRQQQHMITGYLDSKVLITDPSFITGSSTFLDEEEVTQDKIKEVIRSKLHLSLD